jgi:Flp pilus assembly pilin Flp
MKTWELLKKLHRDERGAEGLEKLLILGAVALPLLGILIYFSNDIMQWVKDIWEKAKGDSSSGGGSGGGGSLGGTLLNP